MKTIVHTKYGLPDELQLKEVEKFVPGTNEVLIKIHATTVTTTDCNARNFTFVPESFMFFARIMFGFKKPKIKILGIDLAGEIEAVGKDVKLFKVGDLVFGSPGTKMGGHAGYSCVPENGTLKPVIDRIYPLEKTAEAFQYVEQGHKKGNVIITIV